MPKKSNRAAHFKISAATNGKKQEESLSGVGLPGLEPRKTGPESVVLPLHHSPKIGLGCKVKRLISFAKIFNSVFCLSEPSEKSQSCLKSEAHSGGTDAKCSESRERNACGGPASAAARSITTKSFCPAGLRTPSFATVSILIGGMKRRRAGDGAARLFLRGCSCCRKRKWGCRKSASPSY